MVDTDESLSVCAVVTGYQPTQALGDPSSNGPTSKQADSLITPSGYMFVQIDIRPVRVQGRSWSGSK
jgi:hypothetical protein